LGGSQPSELRFTRSSKVSIRTLDVILLDIISRKKEVIMKPSRNSLCTCGSGLKYKQCCGEKEGKTSPMLITAALLIGGLIIAGAIFVSQNKNDQAVEAAPAAPSAAGAPQPDGVPGSPQPPGPVPPGKVWNVEHGHWHDAPGAPAPAGATVPPGAAQPAAAQPAQPAFTPGPQPPGPVPPGKVWSAEHGHWHDAPK
jgi:SEC-C motif